MDPTDDVMDEDGVRSVAVSQGAWSGYGAPELEGEGLMSAREWTQMLMGLETQTSVTKNAIQDVLVGHLPQDSSTFSCSMVAGSELKKLRDELAAVLYQATAPDSIGSVTSLRETERNRILSQLKRLESHVSILEQLQEVQSSLQQLDSLVETFKLEEAAAISRAVDEKLGEMSHGEDDFFDSKVFRALRVQLRRKKAKLKTASEDLLESALIIEPNKIQVLVVDDQSKVKQALDTLNVLGGLSSTMGSNQFGASLLNHIVLPIARKPWLQVKTVMGSTCYELTLEGEEPEEDEYAIETARIFENIIHVIKFIAKYILDDNSHWISLIASTLWGSPDAQRLSKDVEDRLFHTSTAGSISIDDDETLSGALLYTLINALPKDVAGLETYASLGTAARNAEDVLVSLGLVSDKTRVISRFLDDIETHLAQKRRAYLLHDARALILDDYFSTQMSSDHIHSETPIGALIDATTKGSEQASARLFLLEPMRITTCAYKVVELAVTALDESVSASHTMSVTQEQQGNHLTIVLYETARDLLELFRAIIPIHYKNELSSPLSARMALLYHNDCLFIAHYLVLLGHCYQSQYLSTFANKIVTVDLVPAMRESAQNQFIMQLKLQIDRFETEIWKKDIEHGSKDRTGQQIVDIIHSKTFVASEAFTKVFQEWVQILSKSNFNESIAKIADAVLGQCVNLVTLSLGKPTFSLSPNEILTVRQSLQNFKDTVYGLIESKLRHNTDGKVPNLLALTQMCSVFEQYMSLHMLNDVASQGSLDMLSPAQVKGIAALLFPDET